MPNIFAMPCSIATKPSAHQVLIRSLLFSVTSFSFLISTLLFSLLSAPSGYAQETLTIGVLSSRANKHFQMTQPLAGYLKENLASYGIKNVDVKVHNDLNQIGLWMQSGEIDMLSETPYASLVLEKRYDADIRLLRWKTNTPSYQSVFFTHRDSGIKSFQDLLGKRIAFEDRWSTSGFYVPAMQLIHAGYQLQKLHSVHDPVDADKIGFIFVEEQQHITSKIGISSWVYRKQVEAGAFSNIDWISPEVMPRVYRSKLSIFEQSDFVPRSTVLFRRDLDSNMKAYIIDLLLAADQTPEGQQALSAYENTRKFERLSKSAYELFSVNDIEQPITPILK